MRSQRFRRTLIAAFFALAPGLAVAQEANIFLIDSSDGYGIDTCVASGAACGQAMADAWCRVHDFERASSFGTVTSDALPVSLASKSVSTTTGSVAITCK